MTDSIDEVFRRLKRVSFEQVKQVMAPLDDLDERKSTLENLGWTELEYIEAFINKWNKDSEWETAPKKIHFAN